MEADSQRIGLETNTHWPRAAGQQKLEAVKLALEALGRAATARDVAAYVEAQCGLVLRPEIVSVLLAMIRESEHLQQARVKAHEAMERHRAEQPVVKKSRKKAVPSTAAPVTLPDAAA